MLSEAKTKEATAILNEYRGHKLYLDSNTVLNVRVAAQLTVGVYRKRKKLASTAELGRFALYKIPCRNFRQTNFMVAERRKVKTAMGVGHSKMERENEIKEERQKMEIYVYRARLRIISTKLQIKRYLFGYAYIKINTLFC